MSKPLGFGDSKDIDQVKNLEAARDEEKTVLTCEMDWKSWADSKFITDAEKEMLDGYDKQPLEGRLEILAEHGPQYANVFVKVLDDIGKKEMVKYMLTLMDQSLTALPARAADYFIMSRTNGSRNPYETLTRVLNRVEAGAHYELGKAVHILAILYSYQEVDAESEHVAEFLRWLSTRISNMRPNKDDPKQDERLLMCLSGLKVVLARLEIQVVWARDGGLRALSTVLSADVTNTQVLYMAGFIVWLVSFSPALARKANQKSTILLSLKDCGIVKRLIDIVRAVGREKVIRISVAALRNLLEQAGETFTDEMIGNQLPKILQTLASRKFKDEDLIRDMAVLQDKLQEAIRQLSSFELYHAEVMSGRLSKTPVHTEDFFRENIQKFDSKSNGLVRSLVELLDSQDALTLEMACYDLGEFVRYHPDGKRLLSRLAAKPRLMLLMTNPNKDVAKQALLCVQKLMVNNWEFLKKTATK